MKIMLGTHTSADTNCECDFALVDLTPELAKSILAKLELVAELRKKDDSVTRVEFYSGCTAEFIEYCEEAERIQTEENYISDGVWKADDLNIPEEDFQRTECDRLIIFPNWSDKIGPTIMWGSVPKHSEIEIETDYIELKLIQAIANT